MKASRSRAVLMRLLVVVLSSGPLLAGCGGEPIEEAAPLVITADQEPVAMLQIPAEALALQPAVFSAEGSFDVDGTLVSATFRFGDGEERVAPFAEGAAPTAEHTYAEAGVYDVELLVEDDGGRRGRARARLLVAGPPDATPPLIASLEVRAGSGQVLGDGDVVGGGTVLDVTATAEDAEANLVLLELHAEGPLGALSPTSLEPGLEGDAAPASSRTASWRLHVPDVDGPLTLQVRAEDLYGGGAEEQRTLTVLLSSADSDGDGLADSVDPDPAAFHGASVQAFLLEGFPRDLLQRQEAEAVVASIREAVPVFVGVVSTGFLSGSAPTGAMHELTGLEDGPAAMENYALSFRALLAPPPGADAVVFTVTADDVGVVFMDGQPVASADEEFAIDFFRTARLPATTEPLPLSGSLLPVEIVLANESGPAGWDVDVSFYAGGTLLLPSSSVGQQLFLLP